MLAWRNRLVIALAVGVAVLVLAAVALRYESAPWVLGRFVGHARNFALLALLLALSARLTTIRHLGWRQATSALLVVVVIWPTIVAPVRNLGLAIGQGIKLANAPWPQPWPGGRFALPPISDRIATYLRDHSPRDARVLSPTPPDMSFAAVAFATGRPNAAGFVGHQYFLSQAGPEYLDALSFLEPAAVRRLGLSYLHAPDAWVAGLPDRATGWLANPGLFELVVRDGDESLYRVRTAFLRLDVAPAPASFEALRQAVPADTTVYLPAPFRTVDGLRAASALSHARLFGHVDPTMLHLLTPWPSEPLAAHVPDLVIMWAPVDPWMFPPGRTTSDLVERKDRRLRAEPCRRSDHAVAAKDRARASACSGVRRTGARRTHFLHHHLQQPRS